MIINNSKSITMECCLGELSGYCSRNDLDFNKCYSIIKKKSIILPVMQEQWIKAGIAKTALRKEKTGFGLIDAILLVKQRELKCKLVSGDSYFKGLKNIVFLG